MTTPYQHAVLVTLATRDRAHVRAMGGSAPHLTRALRSMEERRLVGRNSHDEWYLRPEGRDAIEAREGSR